MARFRPPFQLVLPGIQQLPLQLQFPRQSPNVFTGFHSFDDLPLELHAVSTPLCHSCPSCHFVSIRCKVRLFRVSHFRGSVHAECRLPRARLGEDWNKIVWLWFGALKAAGLNHRVMPVLSTSGLIPVASARVEYQPAKDGV